MNNLEKHIKPGKIQTHSFKGTPGGFCKGPILVIDN